MARAAGAVALEHALRGPAAGLASKSTPTDPVTAADRASEELLLELLAEARPDDAVLGEEGGVRPGTSGLSWVCDPLDGTVNFLFGVPQWAVSVACEDADGAIAGCVYDPSRDEAFVAARGAGATLNGAPIRVRDAAELAQALVATGFGYAAERRASQARQAAEVIARVRDLRRFGAAALDLAWVACGRLDGYYEAGLNAWDWAAGGLLVREAGGAVTRGPSPHGPDQLVASTPGIHPALVELVGAG